MDNGAALAASDGAVQAGTGWRRSLVAAWRAALAHSRQTAKPPARPARLQPPLAPETAARAPPTPTLHSSSYSPREGLWGVLPLGLRKGRRQFVFKQLTRYF